MNEPTNHFELPRQIDRYLGTLSKVYEQEGNRQLQELIVNAHVRVTEGWSYDNWNGGISGHAVSLLIPEALYLSIIKVKNDLENQIKAALNDLHKVQDESFDQVFLEMEEVQEWRKQSGLLLDEKRVVSTHAVERIWERDCFRVFLSHRSNVKNQTAYLKNNLRLFGISAFVAHEDIHPTKAWQDEIENALGSMDSFVALMTSDFHESEWTDQEVGFAVGRGVPIIAVRMGKDPYGFIGKFQALPSTWLTAHMDISKVLIKNDRMFTAYLKALRHCPNWDSGNTLASVLPSIDHITMQQIDELIEVYNQTDELRGSFGFNGTKRQSYGTGLVSHLERLDMTRRFRYSQNGIIEVVPR